MGAKRNLYHRFFLFGQSCGVDVLPRHFYSSIPDVRELQRTTLWRRPLSMNFINGAGIDSQMKFIAECCPDMLKRRISKNDIYPYACKCNREKGFGSVEADFLFCFISSKKPRKVIQVGAGLSTAVILLAAQEAGYEVEVVCIDPYPTKYLTRISSENRIRLIPEKAQEVSLDTLADTGKGGLLFIDSTHTVKAGSEVNRIMFEVMPELGVGTYIHFHDIFFPYDYAPSLLQSAIFFSLETTLLYALLLGNARYKMLASLSMLHNCCPAVLRTYFPYYRPAPSDRGLLRFRPTDGTQFPCSTYLEVTR